MFRILAILTLFFFQQAEFRLDVRRDFGYGNGADVRGNFSMTVHGDQNAIRAVTYYIDEQEMGRFTEPPFKIQFKTSDYSSGVHELTAMVETVDGRQVNTPTVQLNFLSQEQQSESFQKIFIPLGGILIAILAITAGVQYFAMRGNEHLPAGAPRSYGMMGGTICPRCDRPFARHVWGINLVAGKLDRCPYCGKWFLATRRSPAELAAAEQAELATMQSAESGPLGSGQGETAEERLRKQLDESRYTK